MSSSPTVTPTAESMNTVMKAMTANLGPYMDQVNKIIQPSQQAEVNANRNILPQQNQIQLESMKKYLPAFTDLDVANNKTRALATVNQDANALQTASDSGLIDKALALQRQADPEYYKNRELLSGKLEDLSKFDPNHLSGSEIAETTRGLNQTSQGAPNLGAALQAAATFGSKLAQRRGENVSNIQTITNALPQMRSGFDPFMVATGKNSGPGQAAAGNIGYNTGIGSGAQGMANNIFNSAAQFQGQAAQNQFMKPTGLDQAGKMVSIGGQLIGGIAGAI